MYEIPQIIINESGGIFALGDSSFSLLDFLTLGISFFALWFSTKEDIRSKKGATIHAFDTLQEKLYAEEICIWKISKEKAQKLSDSYDNDFDKIKGKWKSITRQLMLVEHFCVGINTGIYDIKTLNSMAGKRMIKVRENINPIIKKKRSKSNKYKCYEEFDKVVKKLNRMNNDIISKNKEGVEK